MARADDLYDDITEWGYDKKTELEIVNKLAMMLKASPSDIDLYYDINDALYWHGYSYQFKVPEGETLELDLNKYFELIKNVTKSESQTNELMIFLRDAGNYRLTLNSLKFIKMKHLIALGVFNQDIMKNFNQYNLYDLYMMSFSSKYDEVFNNQRCRVKGLLEVLLRLLGMDYIDLDYMQFRIEMEYLLWTITQNDKSKENYKKVNTIKVAMSIAPRELFVFNDKIYYNENISKNLISYLGLIDKAESKRIFNKYKESIDKLDDTGYKLLFNML